MDRLNSARLSDEQYKLFTTLQQEPCISCGHIPAGGIYHDTVPCCIECYLNDSLVKLLQQQEIRAQAKWIDVALEELLHGNGDVSGFDGFFDMIEKENWSDE
jgi:hypothetical protein